MSRAPPQRHWRSYGNDPLPTGAEALDEPFAAFPSWFMRVTCERCGQERMFNEAHSSQRTMRIASARMTRTVRFIGQSPYFPGTC